MCEWPLEYLEQRKEQASFFRTRERVHVLNTVRRSLAQENIRAHGVAFFDQIFRGIVVTKRRKIIVSQMIFPCSRDDCRIHEGVSHKSEQGRDLLWMWIRIRVLVDVRWPYD